MTQSKRLIFVESRVHVEFVLEDGLLSENVNVVALNPEAMYALDRAGIGYAIPEDYYSDDEWDQIALENMAYRDELCKWLDGCLSNHCQSIREFGLAPSVLHSYHLKVLLDSITTRIFGLQRIIATERPASVFYFPTEDRPISWELVFFSESIYSHLMPLVATSLGVDHQPLCEKPLKQPKRFRQSNGIGWKAVLRGLGLRNAARRLRYLHASGSWSRAISRRSNGFQKALIIMRSPDIDAVLLKSVKEDRLRFILWDGHGPPLDVFPWRQRGPKLDLNKNHVGDTKAETKLAWRHLLDEDDGIERFFTFRGVNYWHLVQPRLHHFVTQGVVDIVNTYLQALNVLTRRQADVVLTATTFSYRHRAIVAAARKLRIPVVIYQHGGAYGYRDAPVSRDTDFAHCSHFVSYGRGVADFFNSGRSLFGKPLPKIVPLGSASLENLYLNREHDQKSKTLLLGELKLNPRKKTIVYAPVHLGGNYRYGPRGTYPDNLYYRLQTQIVDVVCSFPDAQLVVKLPTPDWTYNPLPEYIKSRDYSNCRVLRRGWFEDLLSLADAFIVDWPATVLLQALTTRKPVLVLADRRTIKLDAHARELLERRTSFTDQPDVFVEAIENFLRRSDFNDGVPVEDSFLQQYGIGPCPGASLNAASDFLATMSREPSPIDS